MLKNDEFYEHAEIFDNFYGTSKKSVEELIKKKMTFFLILIGKVHNNFQNLKS